MPSLNAAALDPDALPEIFQVAQHWEQKQAKSHSYHSTHWDGLHGGWDTFVSYEGAGVLMPLRGRDQDALRALFDRADMSHIEENIETNLDQRRSSQDWENVSSWLL